MCKNHISLCCTAAFALSVAAFAFASCSDCKELDAGLVEGEYTNQGIPDITAIYDVQDTAHANPLVSGVLNQYIHLVGHNLANPVNININGLDVDIQSRVFAKSSEAYIRIPRAIPENETGMLRYETAEGVFTQPFDVSIPSLELQGFVNEFTLPGTRAQLSGDYFDLYGFGDTLDTSPVSIVARCVATGYEKVLKCDSCTETFTSIIIPADCPENTLFTFSWNGVGGGRVEQTISYRATDALLFGNFDGDLGWWNDDGKAMVTDGTRSGDPASLGYNFLRFTKTGGNALGAWDWWSTGFGCSWPFDITFDTLDDYVFKFETCTDASYPFYSYGDNGKNGARNGGYCFTLGGPATRNQWDPVSDGLTNTNGKWITVRLPLRDMFQDIEEMPAVDAWVSLEMVCQPNNSDGWEVDHCFGQFRVEKIW